MLTIEKDGLTKIAGSREGAVSVDRCMEDWAWSFGTRLPIIESALVFQKSSNNIQGEKPKV